MCKAAEPRVGPKTSELTVDITILRCPLNGDALRVDGEWLISTKGERYPIIQGVPVLLVETNDPTLWVVSASYNAARDNSNDVYHEDTIGCGPVELGRLRDKLKSDKDANVDPVIASLVAATGGHLYLDLVGALPEVPIPNIRLSESAGSLLDIGCNWGRWSIAAARKGRTVVGIDPSLGAVLAAKRLADKLGVDAQFIVGDALRLPFAAGTFDTVFSYSVLQHFSREDCAAAIREAARVSALDGSLMVQMPNAFGLRSSYHIARRRCRSVSGFAVRYYTPRNLSRMFADNYGANRLEVDGYFGLGIQPSDRRLLSPFKRRVIDASEFLRGVARWLPGLKYIADSLYVHAQKTAASPSASSPPPLPPAAP
jgi:2-polyprenyl-3-methyl-5-hydroxy-6-metoxy-1,4-benzoquinol methylase